jgi:hypothetical protein
MVSFDCRSGQAQAHHERRFTNDRSPPRERAVVPGFNRDQNKKPEQLGFA